MQLAHSARERGLFNDAGKAHQKGYEVTVEEIFVADNASDWLVQRGCDQLKVVGKLGTVPFTKHCCYSFSFTG